MSNHRLCVKSFSAVFRGGGSSEEGVQVKLIKGILLGIVALATSQAIAKADDGTTKDIRLLKAELKKRRSILLQPALRFLRRRLRTQDRRSHRDDPGALLPILIGSLSGAR